MIIDCDTHVIPRDAFDYVGEEFAALRPVFHFDEKGHYWHCDFPGRPEEVPGTTPLPGIRGAGTDFDGMCDMEARLEDFAKLGVDMQVIGPQFTGWWSYLIEPELATAMARSHNVAVLKIMKSYPGRYIGAALVALQNVEGAIREMEWAYDRALRPSSSTTLIRSVSIPLEKRLAATGTFGRFSKEPRRWRCRSCFTPSSTATGS